MVKSARENKLYRCPPTPQPSELYGREKSFVLDCVAVNNISKDYANCNPKLGTIIPPYNGQKDRNAASYFRSQNIRAILHRTGQSPPGTPIEGIVEELFFTKGSGYRYLSRRNDWGCGRSHDLMSGHSGMFTSVRPITGYSGDGGYRRNTPSLRRYPSCFGPPVFYLPQITPRVSASKSARENTTRDRQPEKVASETDDPNQPSRSRRQSRHSVGKSAGNSPEGEKQEKENSEKDGEATE